MKLTRIKYKSYDALKLTHGSLELMVTTSCGPRVISLKSAQAESVGNLFYEFPEPQKRYLGQYLRGGHRLWHAPEDLVKTYLPDDEALHVKLSVDGVSLTQPIEKKTGLEKSIQVKFVSKNTVKISHTLKNKSKKPITRAAWAVTMLPPKGYGFFTLPPKGDHAKGDLLPTTVLIPWTFTDFSSPVWDYHQSFIGVNVAKAKNPQKLGIYNYPGISGYWREGVAFIKYAKPNLGKPHTDMGSSFETFTNGQFFELETLSDLRTLKAGQKIVHTEYWTVLANIPKPSSDRVYTTHIQAPLKKWVGHLL